MAIKAFIPGDIAPFSISAFCKLWVVNDGHTEPTGFENSLHLFERLDTDAPEDAKPHVAWGEYIDFWDAGGHNLPYKRISFHPLSGAHPNLLGIHKSGDLTWYEAASGQVVHHLGHWCMRWLLYKHTRMARMMNEGFGEYRK